MDHYLYPPLFWQQSAFHPQSVPEYYRCLQDLEIYATYVPCHVTPITNPSDVPSTLTECQVAIDRAWISIRENKYDGAAEALLGIDGSILWRTQQKHFPEPAGIEEQNRTTASDADSIAFWRRFNNCWLSLGQGILVFDRCFDVLENEW
ncbi:hypothetical protein BBP40_003102 [Aspergillus hancockii]|nr:hypothetical protein BBP40_003102 [Aspergillus hancockii]